MRLMGAGRKKFFGYPWQRASKFKFSSRARRSFLQLLSFSVYSVSGTMMVT
jgi:hypothetical protein